MILPFSTQINGQPTHFVEKIWKGLKTRETVIKNESEATVPFEIGDQSVYDECLPKLHTIRLDAKRRWRSGVDIHFYVNNRQPDMRQFAPVIKVVSTQRIFMSYFHELEISIDSRQLTNDEIDALATNDGFDSYEDFERYFMSQLNDDKEFSGKIIHWTDFQY